MRPKAIAVLLGLVWVCAPAAAQQVISAKSGTINYIEGAVSIDSKPIELRFGSFPRLRENSELRTAAGRAEILLADGVFVRLGENSALRMVSDQLTDTRLELLAGSVLVEWVDTPRRDPAATLTLGDATVTLLKHGLYRLDSQPPQVKVYAGEARVSRAGQTTQAGKARLLVLTGVAVPERFDTQAGDALFRWTRRRSEYLAVANLSAARYADRLGGYGSAAWLWNPYYGMFTYVPLDGFCSNFWGYRFWSPSTVYYAYVPQQSSASGGSGPVAGTGGSRSDRSMGPPSAGASGATAHPSQPTAGSSGGPRPNPR
jgi:hypothetical protein